MRIHLASVCAVAALRGCSAFVLAPVKLQSPVPVLGMIGSVEERADVAMETNLFEPSTTKKAVRGALEDNNAFAWLGPYLELFGFEEGKTVVFATPVPFTGERVSPEEAQLRRANAAKELINIGPDERARRAQVSKVMFGVTAATIIWSTLINDDGSFSGQLGRLSVLLPFFLATGFRKSAEAGL